MNSNPRMQIAFINLSTQLVEPGKDCDYKEHGDAMISQDC